MLLCGGGNAGNKILQDGDSGWQRSFLLLLGPRHGVSAGAGGFDSAAGAPGAASWFPPVSAGQGWVGKTETSPWRGQHHSQPAASTQSDNFPLPRLASSLANAICTALCIACAWQMTGTEKHGDIFIPHSPSHFWDRKQAPSLELLWLLPSSGQVS